MTSRECCPNCFRFKSLCLCPYIQAVNNSLPALILQHPNEAGHAKNTASLLCQSLSNCRVEVGEQFDPTVLKQWLHPSSVLLYPETEGFMGSLLSCESMVPTKDSSSFPTQLVVLDGTWKKTRKMLYLNPLLAALPRCQFAGEVSSRYRIRKQKQMGLSTLEAVHHAFVAVEKNAVKYAPLLQLFEALMRQQESFLPDRNGRP